MIRKATGQRTPCTGFHKGEPVFGNRTGPIHEIIFWIRRLISELNPIIVSRTQENVPLVGGPVM